MKCLQLLNMISSVARVSSEKTTILSLWTRSFLAKNLFISVHICSNPPKLGIFFGNPKMTGSPHAEAGIEGGSSAWRHMASPGHLLGTRVLLNSFVEVLVNLPGSLNCDFIKCWIQLWQLWQLCWCILGRFGWVLAGFHGTFLYISSLVMSVSFSQRRCPEKIPLKCPKKVCHDVVVVRSTRTASSDPVRFSSVGRPVKKKCETFLGEDFPWFSSVMLMQDLHGLALSLSGFTNRRGSNFGHFW